MKARAKSVLAMLQEMLDKGVDIAWEGMVYATNQDVRIDGVEEVSEVEGVEQ